MTLKLIELKDIPAEGPHKGVVKNTELKEGAREDGETFQNLVVTVELEPTSTGKKHLVEKTYNLKGRGLVSFRKDYKTLRGKKLTDAELADFDADEALNNHLVFVRVKYKKDGSDKLAVVDAFLPPPAPVPVAA